MAQLAKAGWCTGETRCAARDMAHSTTHHTPTHTDAARGLPVASRRCRPSRAAATHLRQNQPKKERVQEQEAPAGHSCQPNTSHMSGTLGLGWLLSG
jgi:hypothetical protein